jgi:sorting nexin-1/2
VTQATKLEAVDDSLGPLGPLGDSSPPEAQSEDVLASPPIQNRQLQAPSISGTSNASLQTLMGSVHLNEDDDDDEHLGPRVPPPVQPTSYDALQRQTQPSVSLVEAAKPTFHISVGDPHKVGDLTSAHTEYMVSTKVWFFGIRLGFAY